MFQRRVGMGVREIFQWFGMLPKEKIDREELVYI
jgi:hypothetical protein